VYTNVHQTDQARGATGGQGEETHSGWGPGKRRSVTGIGYDQPEGRVVQAIPTSFGDTSRLECMRAVGPQDSIESLSVDVSTNGSLCGALVDDRRCQLLTFRPKSVHAHTHAHAYIPLPGLCQPGNQVTHRASPLSRGGKAEKIPNCQSLRPHRLDKVVCARGTLTQSLPYPTIPTRVCSTTSTDDEALVEACFRIAYPA